MPLRSTSLVLPCRRLPDVPVDLRGEQAAELLAAWTALWHPSLLAATGGLPGWHSADEPPEPDELDGELVVVPHVSQPKLPSRWCEQLRATQPRNPRLVEAAADRAQTVAAVLDAAGTDATPFDAELVQDFLALGYAYLQVELITRAMQYTTVLDREQFGATVVAAARAAAAGEQTTATDGIRRALDMLADARKHYYPVDFYLVDVTLLAESTLGEVLRVKLASGIPTSLLASGELAQQLAREYPDTRRALEQATEAGTACVVGGLFRSSASCEMLSPEAMLEALGQGRKAYRQSLGRDVQVFAQFHAAFSPLLPQVLSGVGLQAALCAAFDGGRLPLAEQTKTRWEGPSGASIDALSIRPLDIGPSETWLALGQRISDSLVRDHVATVLLAGWPAGGSEYYDDLRRIARYGPVLGKLVTLEEYFAVTREAVDWSSFRPSDYTAGAARSAEHVASLVGVYRQHVADVHRRLLEGMAGLLPPDTLADVDVNDEPAGRAVVNPWSFAGAKYVGFDPLEFTPAADGEPAASTGAASCVAYLPDVPGCGYAALETAAAAPSRPLAEGRTLRNERLEVVISAATGGIRSLRACGDRGTRVSQRLAVHDRAAQPSGAIQQPGQRPRPEVQVVADRVEITRSDAVVGQITSHGRLLSAAGEPRAEFVQTVRLPRGLPAAIVHVEIGVPQPLEGASYVASRLAWRDQDVALRRGVNWVGQATGRRRIESPEWVQITGSNGPITLFPLGLPLHQRIGTRMLDTLLVVAGRQQGRFQFAIGLDCAYPTSMALSLLTAGAGAVTKSLSGAGAPQGWLLHISVKNVVLTHLEPLGAGREGVRARLLETEGRPAHATLAAYRPFCSARQTDYRGEPAGVLSVVDGQVHFSMGPHQWLQLEAQW